MRQKLLHAWYKQLSYEIREIVWFAEKVKDAWLDICWENIWDPIAKGETIPDWVKEIIADALRDDNVFGYVHSKWLLSTREYIASKNDKIGPEDIIFFNGLWEAINKIYGYLATSARVLGPNPAYSTHSSAEAANSWADHLTYTLDPNNGWNPDVEEIENKVKFNPNIAGILVINPDNPTGAVFKREVLEQIVDIARRYDLFLVFDEIYEKMVYDLDERVLLSDIIWDIPGISMKGMSKELPWPGGRCGWIEIYNQDKDEEFRTYMWSVLMSKMLEVCSTSLPQYVLPTIYEDERFTPYVRSRVEKYKRRADIAEDILGNIDEIIFVKPWGAFYMSFVFRMDQMNENYKTQLSNLELQKDLDNAIAGKRFDKRFCYWLLASTGICTVPLSWFNSTYEWVRMTLLEDDEEKYRKILETVRDEILMWKK